MHSIHFVDDHQLPQGTDFVVVASRSRVDIFYRESAISEEMLEDSWAAYRTLRRKPPETPKSAPVWTRLLHSVA